MNKKQNLLRVAIFGGSGYGGSELLRILLFHPNAEIALVTANEHVGKAVGEVHRNLNGLTDLRFTTATNDLSTLNDIDIAFFALPHGQAMDIIPKLPKHVRAIDLSGDFRIDDTEVFKEFYEREQSQTEMQKQFVYGLTETNREQIKTAQYIANPGCFATATLLALAPLVKSGLLTGKVIVDAKTGSSGSGAKAVANTHHPQRIGPLPRQSAGCADNGASASCNKKCAPRRTGRETLRPDRGDSRQPSPRGR